VARTVRLEIPVDADDVGMAEFCERTRFLDEAVESPLVVVAVIGRDGHDAAVERAHRELGRQVLLDRNLLVEMGVEGAIRHPERARSQRRLEAVLEQHGPERERVTVGCGLRHCATTYGRASERARRASPERRSSRLDARRSLDYLSLWAW